MRRHVRQVAVLGSGVMGSAIAAHFANAGIPALVLDIVPRELTRDEEQAGLTLSHPKVRNRIAATSVRALAKARPAAVFSMDRLQLIQVGNFEDDLEKLKDADWIIEAVREDMAIKKKVFEAVAPHVRDDAVLSSNTSGLSLNEMAGSLPEGLRGRFLGTHFFNPPRYMRLLELIPTEATEPEVMEAVARVGSAILGKGIVPAKDTPNFIANRIGVHAMMVTVRAMEELGLTIEEVDKLTGPPLGRPKSGTFRLADMVGLDTLMFVANTVRGHAGDESAEVFEAPDFLKKMVQNGLLGQKSGSGFYKRVHKPKKAILTLDLETMEYREAAAPELPELKGLKGLDGAGERIKALVGGDGRAATAAWKILAPTLAYSAMRLGEIADRADAVDDALKLGFNWELGPFEIWDALGFRETTQRLRSDGYALPPWVDALVDSGAETIYERAAGDVRVATATPGQRETVERDPRAIRFDDLRAAGKELWRNDSASLHDLGDRVLGLEFHSKMNAIDLGSIEAMHRAADEAETDWDAIVVANDGGNFSAGANLMMLVESAMKRDFEAIRKIVGGFQAANDRLEQCAVPVVTAPHGMALGGGCEVAMAGNAVRASAEAYIGLVEVGAGLIPAGGGCLRLYRNHVMGLADGKDVYPALLKTFQAIGTAKVSTSAEEARQLGFLGPRETWSMNRDHLVSDAKSIALGMARAGYRPPEPGRTLRVMGRAGMAVIGSQLVNMAEGRFISEHDMLIGNELARILSGGDVPGPTDVSEKHILELELEVFLRLCGEPKTHARIESLLKTGKPLRN